MPRHLGNVLAVDQVDVVFAILDNANLRSTADVFAGLLKLVRDVSLQIVDLSLIDLTVSRNTRHRSPSTELGSGGVGYLAVVCARVRAPNTAQLDKHLLVVAVELSQPSQVQGNEVFFALLSMSKAELQSQVAVVLNMKISGVHIVPENLVLS